MALGPAGLLSGDDGRRETAMATFTLLEDGRATEVAAVVGAAGVRLAPDVVRASLGWELKPQGLCQGDACIPVRADHELRHADGVDLGVLASILGRPLAIDLDARVACLGASAAERGAQLGSLDAPDFTLPDLHGRSHRLSDQRGRKVLLLAWASW